MVESLTSYITRLAMAHCAKSGDLVDQEILPLLGFEYFTDIWGKPRKINGSSNNTVEIAKLFNQLTLRNDLHLLTLYLYNKVFCPIGLLRKHLAWCPHCYQDWFNNEDIVYNPLIWHLKDVSICPIHFSTLIERCPYCNKEIPILSRRSIPGFCSYCGTWLGISETPNEILGENHSIWQKWVIRNLGELLVIAPELKKPLNKVVLSENLSLIINFFGNGKPAVLSKLTGLPRKNLPRWRDGELPTLSNLLAVGFCTGLSLKSLLLQQFSINDFKNNTLRKLDSIKKYKRSVIDNDLVEVSLVKALNSEEPLSISQIAKNLDISRCSIENRFPDLCKQVISNYKECIQKRRLEKQKTFIPLQ